MPLVCEFCTANLPNKRQDFYGTVPLKGELSLPVHGLALHVPEPDPQVGGEALPCQLQHGHVTTYTTRNMRNANTINTFPKQH